MKSRRGNHVVYFECNFLGPRGNKTIILADYLRSRHLGRRNPSVLGVVLPCYMSDCFP